MNKTVVYNSKIIALITVCYSIQAFIIKASLHIYIYKYALLPGIVYYPNWHSQTVEQLSNLFAHRIYYATHPTNKCWGILILHVTFVVLQWDDIISRTSPILPFISL